MIEPAIAQPQDVPREIPTGLAINPSAGCFEGLLDTSIGEKLASALLAEKPQRSNPRYLVLVLGRLGFRKSRTLLRWVLCYQPLGFGRLLESMANRRLWKSVNKGNE
jgi:hypothetical protein